MAYLEHWLLNFGGHQGDINEAWACGIRLHVFGGGLPGDDPDPEDYLDTVAVPQLSAWFPHVDAHISAACKLLWVKFNKIAPSGKYADVSTTHERAVVGIEGAYNPPSNHHPLQVACVLTWRTNAAQRGLASIGRIYSPRPVVSIDAGGDMAGADRVAIANKARDLLQGLDVSTGVTSVLRPAIESRGGGSAPWPNPGQANQIDVVTVDSCLDVHRSRALSQSREITHADVTY